MLKKIIWPVATVFLLSACSDGDSGSSEEDSDLRTTSTTETINVISSYSWADDDGGVFNVPSEEFNPDYYGWGSYGFNTSSGIRYNKVDLHVGSDNEAENTMYIDNNQDTLLYDSAGSVIARVWDSAIGWDYVNEKRDGGIAAGGITEIEIDGVDHTMVYAWSVNSSVGRHSGWIKLSALARQDDIEKILTQNKEDRDAILLASGSYGSGLYEENLVIESYLPDSMYGYYVTGGRDDENGAGRARYYFTDVDDQYITGLMNIPETGEQRYGVAHNMIALGTKFYTAAYVDPYSVALYPAESELASDDIALTLVWGYSYTSAGEKIYSWINKSTLSATGETVGGDTSTVVTITKRNATDYSLNSGTGGANDQNIYLFTSSVDNVNSQWIEVDRGGGYYSYQKNDTDYCIDGGSDGGKRQNVKLWACDESNQDQHWLKSSTDNGAFQLIKRNATGYAVDGGSGGGDLRNIALWDSSNTSHNLQWFITPID